MNDAEPRVMDVSAMRMREATITAGVWLTFGVGACGEAYVALTWSRPHRSGLAVLFALAMLSAMLVMLLPRERVVRSRWREPFFLAWTFLDFALLLVGTLADGGTASPLVLVFFIPVVFSSMSYPLASVVAVGVFSVFSYLALAFIAGGASWAYQGAFAGSLVCTAAMSAWQAQNHNRQHRVLAAVSRTDSLTGCLNRRGFEERAEAELGRLARRGSLGAIVVLDIDHFKPVNDTFGHAAGDQLLCWVTQTLRSVVRPVDAVGRLGGDEFAVLLPEIDEQSARENAKRIEQALRERAPASLGVAVFPGDGTDLELLCRRADARLYASRQGRAVAPAVAPAPATADRTPVAAPAATARSPHGPESRGLESLDLWRAAVDAMPNRTRRAGGRHGVRTLDNELLDQIDASVICTDMNGIVISWNDGASRTEPRRREEVIGRSARELMIPGNTAAVEALRRRVNSEGRWDGELLVRRKDGSLFTIYVRNRLVLGEDGEPAAIVGVAVDISARVAAESELVQSRDYAQAVTECMGEGLFTTDLDGRVTYINGTAEELLGFGEDEHRGRLVGELIETLRGDRSRRPFEESPIARALTREVTVRVGDDLFLGRDARPVPVAYTASPYHTDEGLQGCVVIFSDISERKQREAEQERDVATLACIKSVEQALLDDRLMLYAQPIVELRTGATVKHELLLRMLDRDGAVVPPADFLPVAEQYTLISEIDRWVIKQAARLAGRGCPVQLNLSARSVGDPDVLEHVELCMLQHDVAPELLVFEITETAIVEDEQAAHAFGERLHALGCRLALDDFGTGYGTLTYLKRLPVDYLKLDIEFVRDLRSNSASRHVVQAVVSLARDFGLQTVAEGVEDADTLALLERLGVDLAQGFHIARPEPFAERPGDRGVPAPDGAIADVRPTAHRARRRSRRSATALVPPGDQ